MANITSSGKFASDQPQYCLSTNDFVLLRIIRRQEDIAVMTATAGEDDSGKSAYPDQERLIDAAIAAFSPFGTPNRHANDRHGRPYVEFSGLNEYQIKQAGNLMAGALGVELLDMAELWIELSDAADEDEQVYLSDGMWLAEDGQLTKR
ncbi:hypothetical protein [Mesorhizobium sp. WSM3860]|uniref:hypothetical protein n=1 Tax=Mesorhizobium sp. WSM3860 TaxID=2029403 RepID=UPI000BAF7921|nr:hypothetical protein [Mesorhizobium sp. WSM3860]PBC01449.1 hypothetical protein CK220_25935 [Mesorhizobium sp. WSM3860]